MDRTKYLILAFILGLFLFFPIIPYYQPTIVDCPGCPSGWRFGHSIAQLLRPVLFPTIVQISTKVGYAPPGCFYDKIVCVVAPCPPILICPSPTPKPRIDPTPTCRPRPACLDSTPRCLIPETSDMCPPSH